MSKKKVITVNGDSSKWYDKVIFVVKKDQGYKDVDFVLEAENIISDYMLSSDMTLDKIDNRINKDTKKSKKAIDGIDIFLYVSICICIFTLFCMFFQTI